eukprot:366367-Chlamydomonas_euryale.AAC.7
MQVLASDVDHNCASLMLTVDPNKGFKTKIMFNAGEGLQRLVRENKVGKGGCRSGGSFVSLPPPYCDCAMAVASPGHMCGLRASTLNPKPKTQTLASQPMY